MPGPRRLVDWPWVTVEFECALCRKHGRVRLARIAERHGAEIGLGQLLTLIAHRCGLNKPQVKPRQYEARCAVRYRVPRGGPLPEGAPAREAAAGERWPPRPDRAPPGRLPTIGDALAEGCTAVLVYCIGLTRAGHCCHHEGRVDIDDLALPPDWPFVDIPRARRLRCSRCGSRDVEVRPDRPDPCAVQARRVSGGVPSMHEVNGVLMPRWDHPAPNTNSN